jgi:hypothetical protein
MKCCKNLQRKRTAPLETRGFKRDRSSCFDISHAGRHSSVSISSVQATPCLGHRRGKGQHGDSGLPTLETARKTGKSKLESTEFSSIVNALSRSPSVKQANFQAHGNKAGDRCQLHRPILLFMGPCVRDLVGPLHIGPVVRGRVVSVQPGRGQSMGVSHGFSLQLDPQ